MTSPASTSKASSPKTGSLLALGVMRGLLIRSPHIEKILAGEKTWEMRSSRTEIRGRIALIKAGSGMIVGTATMYGSLPALTEDRWEDTRKFHGVEDLERLRKWKYPWQLLDVIPLPDPIPYDHPKGAVIWVTLSLLNEASLGKTPARLKWLQTIARNPGAKAPRKWYPPQTWCLNNGLTKWSTYQPGRPVCEEVITDLGRQALVSWMNAIAVAPPESATPPKP